MKKSLQMPCKALSLFMAFLLIAISVPVAFAAQVSLAASNITEFPSVSGTIYYGQTVGESLTLTGGEVQYNGEVIPGEFVHTNANERPTGGGTVSMRASFTFNPTDTESYTGFSVRYSRDVTYMVHPVTPVYVDENIKPTIENTEIEAGTKLSDISIIGCEVKNPYYPEESRFLPKTWAWANPDTIVDKSGYYDAVLKGDKKNYNDLTHSIYIEVAGSVLVPTIETSEIALVYDNEQTYSDVKIDNTKAYVTNDDGSVTEVPGTFAVSENLKNRVIAVGEYSITATFTPADTEKYSSVEFQLPLKVNKGTMKFVDENGDEIVPEITVEYGTTFGDIHYYLESYVAGDDAVSIGMVGIENANKTLCKDGTYTASLINRTDTENYERTELPFKIVIKRKTLTPRLTVAVGSDGLIIRDSSGNYSPKGTFTLEYTVDGVPQEPITGIKYETAFEFNHNKSGNYEYTIIYNEAEVDEYFIIDDFTVTNPVFLTWKFSATGMNAPATYTYGDTVTYTAPAIDETMKDKPYYVFSEWSEVKGIEMTDEQKSNPEVSFTMPDNDVELKASYKFSFKAFFEWIWAKVVQFFTFIFNAVRDLFSLATA